jgi:hypothetical protein
MKWQFKWKKTEEAGWLLGKDGKEYEPDDAGQIRLYYSKICKAATIIPGAF